MEVFLIDSWIQKTQDNHFKILRQSVCSSGERVPLE